MDEVLAGTNFDNAMLVDNVYNTNMNVILHQYLISYMYNTNINMLQCLHVAL